MFFFRGLFTWRERKTLVPAGGGWNNVPLRSQAEFSVLVVPKQKIIEDGGDKNKNAVWAFLLSLLASKTTFKQTYHNNQLVVTPHEMVGL